MGEVPEVGPWVKEKLDALARYLDFYTKVLKNQPWRTIYLDAYAGGGRAVIRAGEQSKPARADMFGVFSAPMDPDARKLVEGSPLVALRVANPFDRYIFIEPDPDRVAELEALKTEFSSTRTIDVLRATARDGIAWITAQPITRHKHRGLAFLDPLELISIGQAFRSSPILDYLKWW